MSLHFSETLFHSLMLQAQGILSVFNLRTYARHFLFQAQTDYRSSLMEKPTGDKTGF